MDGAPRLAVHGAGRMGARVAAMAADAGMALVAVVDRQQSGALRLPRVGSLAGLPAVDVLIDFSLPDGAVAAAHWCGAHGVPLVSGTTGLHAAQWEALEQAAAKVPVLHASNFSPGLNALRLLLPRLQQLLGTEASVSLLDVHHVHKQDAPSGTALALRASLGREDLPIESRREGEVVGDHSVRFVLPHETLTLQHQAQDRDLFAAGALRAAHWLLQQPAGFYGPDQWLGSKGP